MSHVNRRFQGKAGEDLAASFLEKQGFKIIARNYRFERGEIDLIAEEGDELVFIEVKKPNNHEGILAERNRINTRFKNKKFRKFINLSQILVFSNNME